MNPLRALHQEGQSLWLDFISRSLLTSGQLQRLIDDDGLRGMTSNPSIFQKSISGSDDYDTSLRAFMAANPNAGAEEAYEHLAIEDIRTATDILRPLYDSSSGGDGYVSLEVSPHLAADTAGTIAAANRLWNAVDRPNLMIKVPATPEGIPAIETLIGQGINVNVTLMFSMAHYDAVSAAYMKGIAKCAAPTGVASVASFFVSRVDTLVDKQLEAIDTPEALALRGKVAVANSQRVYHRFRDLFHGEAFAAQRARGASVQRPLWGSTSTKNPAYSDILYVEMLIGPDTVNTVPMETIDAFRDHGAAAPTLMGAREEAEQAYRAVEAVGIDMTAVTEQLQREGVDAFAQAYDQLLAALEEKRRAVAV